MASVHLSDESSQSNSHSSLHTDHSGPISSGTGGAFHHKRTSTTEKSAEALAAAAEASKLAKKVRDRSTEQAIDKPTREFDRKRSNSGTSTVQEKGTAGGQESTDGLEDLRPLTSATTTTTEVGSTSRKSRFPQDCDQDKREMDEAASPPEWGFKDPNYGTPSTDRKTASSGVQSEHLPSQMPRNAPSTSAAPRSLFAFPESGRFYRIARPICGYLEVANVKISRKAFRLFEWCDLTWTPDIIRHTCQDILTEEWTRRVQVPFLQGQLQPAPPAHVAAGRLESVIREVFDKDPQSELEVFEFCAGSSGPTPTLERLINQYRTSRGERPIKFRISDKYPNLQAWKKLRGSSNWLDFVDVSVDAISPPGLAMSSRYATNHSSKAGVNDESQRRRIFRLFNCSFHHFDDATAIDILRSTMETSDGFAIIELQDRRLGMLAMMLFNSIFVCSLIPSPARLYESSSFRTHHAFRLLIGTLLWVATLLVLEFDGIVSCLRTREFDEFARLVQQASRAEGAMTNSAPDGKSSQVYHLPSWEIRAHEPILHTLPFGYVRMFTGVRKSAG